MSIRKQPCSCLYLPLLASVCTEVFNNAAGQVPSQCLPVQCGPQGNNPCDFDAHRQAAAQDPRSFPGAVGWGSRQCGLVSSGTVALSCTTHYC